MTRFCALFLSLALATDVGTDHPRDDACYAGDDDGEVVCLLQIQRPKLEPTGPSAEVVRLDCNMK